ncbi:uncharacterized protein GLRG_00113 [Colletotrichum graminicola M1.001]|uniref:Uncharacterized protein n=1 Tax=Colletotrichum graminicola (strain M1.001 / M2 / FGSC 10212) TaxID=645133 RepID=E3Q2Z0_COLGM|nr:uncharacterized protein GLRG_00113 [Colletotrichum graminicola M1.001]EFQ24969.1 hypothetical protein GLRG_00113 [Colletotrichum graminicola M1.001]
MPISNYHTACSAGAVYGTLTFLSRAMTGCVALFRLHTTDGKVSDIFGVWEAVLPDEIIVTEEGYLQMQRGLASTLTQCFRTGPLMLSSLFNCCCCFFNTRGRKMINEMRVDIFGDDNMVEQTQDGGNVMARGKPAAWSRFAIEIEFEARSLSLGKHLITKVQQCCWNSVHPEFPSPLLLILYSGSTRLLHEPHQE